MSRKAIVNHQPSTLSHAIRFLHDEYATRVYWWELVELARKLALTGFLQLFDSEGLTRPVLALLLSIAHLVLLQAAMPYKQTSTFAVAVALSLTLTCNLFASLLFKVYTATMNDVHIENRLFVGIVQPLSLSLLLVAFNIGVLVLLALLLCSQVAVQRREQTRRLLRWSETGEPVNPPASRAAYHLFLSHEWGSGQEKMRVIKQRLLEMVPRTRIFLDVDDLEDISQLEAAVDGSDVMLVCCSVAYAKSRNCMRELRHAVHGGKKLIALLESDATHGAISPSTMEEHLVASDTARSDWGFQTDEDLAGAALAAALFAMEPIEWTRLGAYQSVTMRLIAERLLGCAAGVLFAAGELEMRKGNVKLAPLHPPLRYHLYVPQGNEGANELVQELNKAFGLSVLSTNDIAQIDVCAHALIYLTGRTWAASGASELTQQVKRAMEHTLHVGSSCSCKLLLVHEQPGHGQAQRHAVEFSTILEHTPPELVEGGIYQQIALPLKGGELRHVGCAMLVQAISGVLVHNETAPRQASTMSSQRGLELLPLPGDAMASARSIRRSAGSVASARSNGRLSRGSRGRHEHTSSEDV